MTVANKTDRMTTSWGINRKTVHRDVWTNNWTVVTRLWFQNNAPGIIIKFGETWERWDNGLLGISNYGGSEVDGIDINNPLKNLYITINNPSNNPTFFNSHMTTIGTSILHKLIPVWLLSPNATTTIDGQNVYGGVYIIISYDKTAITIKLCASDGIVYYSAKTNYNPLLEDRRPFFIYNDRGVPSWYYGIVLINTQGNTPQVDIEMFKNQFSSIY
jgi:hypothetical protein